jgi:cytochrome c biogenesis protein CcdA
MTSLSTGLLAAAWLGILTSISPCPLATNIAAVSYLSRRMHSRRLAALGALAYAAGRTAVYVAIGLVVAWGISSSPRLSAFLQENIGPFVGPVLIVVALVLLGWIRLPLDVRLGGQTTAERLASLGVAGEFLIGALFALTFCPVSAALFFGTLIPLALASASPLPPLAVYGIGTALPVAAVSVTGALGLASSGKMLAVIQRWQSPLQNLTASLILLIGIYLTVTLSLKFS